MIILKILASFLREMLLSHVANYKYVIVHIFAKLIDCIIFMMPIIVAR